MSPAAEAGLTLFTETASDEKLFRASLDVSSRHSARSLELKQRRKIATAIHDTLESHHVVLDEEQDYMVAGGGKSHVFADIGPQLIERGMLSNLAELGSKLPNHLDGAARIVLGHPFSDLVKVSLDSEGKPVAHYSASFAVSAIA